MDGRRWFFVGFLAAFAFPSAVKAASDYVPIPGHGRKVAEVGDDFEDEKWNYIANLPKASKENDGNARLPGGVSANGRWYEPELRGAPDVVKRVPTPEGGLPGSKGSMLMRTLWSGVPNEPSFKVQQDDFVANVGSKIGAVPVSRQPSVVVRVYLQPFEKWEQRTGNSFGFRVSATTTKHESSGRRWFGGMVTKQEPYWPGMFIYFDCKADGHVKENSARILVRADGMGHDIPGATITKTGWWTLGISFSSDGNQVNYFAKAGVEDLTAADHIASYQPYSYHCERIDAFFFDVLNMDDGKTWSTDWIVDDPTLYVEGQ